MKLDEFIKSYDKFDACFEMMFYVVENGNILYNVTKKTVNLITEEHIKCFIIDTWRVLNECEISVFVRKDNMK